MAARHCEPCNVLLPARNEFMKCPRCKEPTQWDARDPMSEQAFEEFRRTFEPEKYVNHQMLVVLKKNGRVVPYAACYDQDEMRLQTRRAVEHYGTAAGVRAVFEPPDDPAQL